MNKGFKQHAFKMCKL